MQLSEEERIMSDEQTEAEMNQSRQDRREYLLMIQKQFHECPPTPF